MDLIGECEEIDLIGEYDEGTNGEEVTTDEFENFLKKRVEAVAKKETEVRLLCRKLKTSFIGVVPSSVER